MNTKELVSVIQKLNTICYNINYKQFEKYFSEALGTELHESYVKEKWNSFTRLGLGFINTLDDNTAEKFLKQLLGE